VRFLTGGKNLTGCRRRRAFLQFFGRVRLRLREFRDALVLGVPALSPSAQEQMFFRPGHGHEQQALLSLSVALPLGVADSLERRRGDEFFLLFHAVLTTQAVLPVI